MFRAIRAFVRYNRYPETRPYRWRVFWVSLAYSLTLALQIIALSPLIVVGLIALPFHLAYEWVERRKFWWPTDLLMDRVERMYRAECKRLNPIYFKAKAVSVTTGEDGKKHPA